VDWDLASKDGSHCVAVLDGAVAIEQPVEFVVGNLLPGWSQY